MKKDKFRILSLDGGGIRGIFSCLVLEKLSSYLQEPLTSHFDLVIGTSTGSLIGGMLSSGVSATEMLNLYKSFAQQVFTDDTNIFKKYIKKLGLKPRYDITKLENIILENLGSHSLNELRTRYMAIAYDLKEDKPLFFRSWDEDLGSLRLVDVITMSSACPSLFPGKEFIHKGKQYIVVDGGLGVCNPIMVGVSQGIKEGYALEDIYVVSIGTGEEPCKITLNDVNNWGTVQWATKLIDILFSANDEVQTTVARSILGPNNVFRFQVNLQNNPMGVVCPDTLASGDLEVINKFIELGTKYVLLEEVNVAMKRIQDIWLEVKLEAPVIPAANNVVLTTEVPTIPISNKEVLITQIPTISVSSS